MMRLGRATFLMGLTTLLPAAARAQGDLEKLQGTWTGRAFDGQLTITMVIKGTDVTSTQSGRGGSATTKGVLRIDESSVPKSFTIDMRGDAKVDLKDEAKAEERKSPTTGTIGKSMMLGIYKLEGDTFTLCADVLGEKRPTQFSEDRRKGGGLLLVYSRPGAAKAAAPGSVDLPKLQGAWKGVLDDGAKKTDVLLVIDKKTATIHRGEDRKHPASSSIALNEQLAMKGIDFKPHKTNTAEPLKGFAIYRLDEDRLEIAIHKSGSRPKDFTASKTQPVLTLTRTDEDLAAQPAAKSKGQLPQRRPRAPRRPGSRR